MRLLVLAVTTMLLAGCTADTPAGSPTAPAAEGTSATEAEPIREGSETRGPHGDNRTQDGAGNETAPDRENELKNETVAPFDPGWPELAQARIRPGVQLETSPATPTGIRCTVNFVFAPPDNTTLYVGATSHCLAGRAIGETVGIADIDEAGTIAYCSYVHELGLDSCAESPQVQRPNDFALIEIHAEHRATVHPALIHWGGPITLSPAPPADDTKVYAYVNSSLNPDERFRRAEGQVAASSPETTVVRTIGYAGPGASGAPVTDAEGEAVGHMMAATTDPPGFTVSNLPPMLDFMAAHTGMELELKCWKVMNVGVLP